MAVAAVCLSVLVGLSACTIGDERGGSLVPEPPSTTSAQPDPVPPEPPPSTPPEPSPSTPPGSPPPSAPGATTTLQRQLDAGGLTDVDLGFDRRPEGPEAYGLDAPTIDLCEDADETDQLRVDRVQHWWESPGWSTGEDPAVAISAELVVYESGGGEAAMAAFLATLTECPERTLEDGSTITFEGLDPPPGALPGSAALRGLVTTAGGDELQQVLVAQREGDLLGMLYVTAFDATATTEAARVSTILAAKLSALAAELGTGTGT